MRASASHPGFHRLPRREGLRQEDARRFGARPFALVCDNAAVRRRSTLPHRLMRTEVWKYCDPDRRNTPPHVLDDDFRFESYAEYILDTPAIVRVDDAGEALRPAHIRGNLRRTRP